MNIMSVKLLITSVTLIVTYGPLTHSFSTNTNNAVLLNVESASVISPGRRRMTPAFMASTDTDVVTNPRDTGLALMLDDGTRKSHSLAENTAFVSGFFKGLGTREAYRTLLTSLYFVYTAMETSFDDSTLPAVNKLDDRELRRLRALEEDMDYFYGDDWRDTIVPTSNAERYASRVQHVAKEQPYLLVAHQYTRYLGDLFGGRMMGGMAKKSLGLDEGKGVAFYTFDDIPNVTDFITDWYTRLNDLDLTDKEMEEIVDEANLVFEMNIGIFEDLEGSPLTAMWTLAVTTFKEKLGLTSK